MPGTVRKLTTIVAADVVSFSKLMGEDETAAHFGKEEEQEQLPDLGMGLDLANI